MTAVHRCGLLLHMSHVAWFVCVCWARGRAVQTRLNRSRCRLGADSCGSWDCMRWVPGARFTKYLTTNLGKTYDKLRIFPKFFCKSGPRSPTRRQGGDAAFCRISLDTCFKTPRHLSPCPLNACVFVSGSICGFKSVDGVVGCGTPPL